MYWQSQAKQSKGRADFFLHWWWWEAIVDYLDLLDA